MSVSRYNKEIMETVICNESVFRLYLSKAQIEKRVRELARKIDRDFKEKKPVFVGVLNGVFIFIADLMRYVTIPCEVDFIKLSSYSDEKISTGQVTERKELDADIQDRHVILVEDIIDTGLSMKYIMDRFRQRNPESVSVLTLLHKPDSTMNYIDIDYIGFKIPSLFIVGYGMDFAQEGRNLSQIYVIDNETSNES